MLLAQAQKNLLAAHLAANTNNAVLADGSTFVINTVLTVQGPTYFGAIADWYNQIAQPTDNEPFANLMFWNPNTTIQLLNGAIDWTTDVDGIDDTAKIKNWLKWQSMTWNNYIDMTDPQVRIGVISVWGDASTTVNNIGKATGTLCGKINGRRIELAISPAATGGGTGLGSGAHICPKDANGAVIAGVSTQKLTAGDIDKVLFPNG